MFEIEITFSRGKDFTRQNTDKVVYTVLGGEVVIVAGNDLLTHRFPINSMIQELQVYSGNECSNILVKEIRSISVKPFDPL